MKTVQPKEYNQKRDITNGIAKMVQLKGTTKKDKTKRNKTKKGKTNKGKIKNHKKTIQPKR